MSCGDDNRILGVDAYPKEENISCSKEPVLTAQDQDKMPPSVIVVA